MHRAKWVVAVILLLSLALSGAVIVGQRSAGRFCLLIQNGDDTNTFFDPQINVSINQTGPKFPLSNDTIILRNISPDGSYAIYTHDKSNSTITELWLYSLRNDSHVQPTVIVDNIVYVFDGEWSSDSQRYALQWEDSKGQEFIAVARPDGSKQMMSFGTDKYVQHYGWSADDSYYIFGVGNNEKQTLYFWSRATQQFIRSTAILQVRQMIDTYTTIGWSPRAHTLAFISPDRGDSATLQIINPEGDIKRSFHLDSVRFSPKINWSPDAAYLALSDSLGSTWYVDVFGVDGSEYRNLSHMVTHDQHYLNSDNPRLAWADDKLLFMEETTPGSDDSYDAFNGRLKVFDAAGQRQYLVAENVATDSFEGSGRQRAMIEWQEDGKNVVGTVDISSGQRFPILTSENEILVELSPNRQFAFVRTETNHKIVAKLVSIDSSREQQISGANEGTYSVWSPDSTVLFVFDTGASPEVLTIVRADGTAVAKVNGYYQQAQWTPCN